MPAYGPLCTQFYDAHKPVASDEEIAWYAARLPTDEDPALEVMCGSGRVLIPLLDADVDVHGCDSSAAMLASCEARLDMVGYQTSLFRQDATSLNLPFRYSSAFIAAGSFQLLVDPLAAQAALERIRAHLIGPGLLFLDLFIPAEALHPPGAPVVEARTLTLPDGKKIAHRSESTVDVDARRIDTRTRYEKRSGPMILAREDETLGLTWYDEDEIKALLVAAGYHGVEILPPSWPVSADAPADERRFAISARA